MSSAGSLRAAAGRAPGAVEARDGRPLRRPDVRRLLPLIGVLVVAVALRYARLGDRGLWLGETFSWWVVRSSWAGVVSRCAEGVYPPAYHLLLKGWVFLFGDSVLSMRSLSVALDAATVVLIYSFTLGLVPGRGAAARRAGLLAAVLAALSPFRIALAQEARMYPLGALLAVASSWALWRGLHAAGPGRAWAGYAASAVGLVYTHNYGLFTVAAQAAFAGTFLALKAGRREPAPWAYGSAAFLTIALAYAPWVPVLRARSAQVAKEFWTPPLDLGAAAGAIEGVFSGVFHPFVPAAGALAPLCVVAVLVGVTLRERSAGAFLAVLTVVPFLLGAAVSGALGQNIVVSRYLSFAFPFLLVAVALLISAIPAAPWRAVVGVLVALEFGIGDLVVRWQDDPGRHPGMRAVAEVLGARYRPGDLVVAFDADSFLTSSYYLRGTVRPLYLAEGDDYAPFEAIVAFTTPDRLSAAELGDRARGRVWVISGDKSRRKEGYIGGDWKQVARWSFKDAAYRRPYAYLRLFRAGTPAAG